VKVFNLIKKDIQIFLKSKSSVVLTYLVPMILSLVFGLVFGGVGGSSGMNEIKILLVDGDKTEISREFTSALDSLPELIVNTKYAKNDSTYSLDEATMDDLIKKGKRGLGIYIPAGFADKLKQGTKLPLEIHYDPKNQIQYGMVNGLLQKTIMSKFPMVMLNGLMSKTEEYLGKARHEMFQSEMETTIKNYFPVGEVDVMKGATGSLPAEAPNIFDNPLEIEQVKLLGEEKNNPMYSQYVAGMAVLFLLFSVTYSGASLLEEKNAGTIKRLLISPISRGQILTAKMIFTSIVGISQLTVLFIFGWLVFGLNIFQAIPTLLVLIVVTSLACSALGIFIAAICNNLRTVQSLSTLIILTMSLLGGSMVPTIVMPKYLQTVGKFTLNYWAMHGFNSIFWRNLHLGDIMLDVAVLFGIFIIFYFTGVRLFKKRLVTY